MSEYALRLNDSSCHSIYDIIDWCHEAVADLYKARPWLHPELQHGIALLASSDALNCYMSAYGEMHASKCRVAMMNFPFEDLQGAIEIVDWGCGQGIGSGVVVEALKERDLLKWIKKITLIEPSPQALDRAVSNISKITQERVQIDSINKSLSPSEEDSKSFLDAIGYKYPNIIHIFSNILDVKEVDLPHIARMVASSQGKQFVLCVGPKNKASYRMEQFCAVFGDQDYFSKEDNDRYGRTLSTGHLYTCMTRCFCYNGCSLDMNRMLQYPSSDEVPLDEYDLRLQIQSGAMSDQKARVAYRLENILSVDDILYVDPIINEVKVDFIIVRPNRGMLLINLFEHDLHNCKWEPSDPLSENHFLEINLPKENIRLLSPLKLIEKCQDSVVEGIEELLLETVADPRKLSLIKKVVIFTENSKDTVDEFFKEATKKGEGKYVSLFGGEFIKDKRVSLNLYRTTKFSYYSNDFNDAVKRKIASLISPSWHSYQEGRHGLEPKGAQRGLVQSRPTEQKISGVAGSGKTQVLAIRAINALKRTGGNVLILTFNITLANYLRSRLSEIREDFYWDKIEICHYHKFFRLRAYEGNPKPKIRLNSYEDITFFDHIAGTKRYAAIFVDEVQDYKTEWLQIVKRFLEPKGEFVVFGDPKQNIYHRELDANKDIRLGVIRGLWNKELNTSLRFTNPLLAYLASSFQSTFLSGLPTDQMNLQSSALNFQTISYIDLSDDYSEDKLTTNIIEILTKDNSPVKDFVILAPSVDLLQDIDYLYRKISGKQTEISFVSKESQEQLEDLYGDSSNWGFRTSYRKLEYTRRTLFTADKPYLKISTIQSFKGWESPSVIIILDEENKSERSPFDPMTPEIIYTAITRARDSLYLVNIGNNRYSDFFKQQAL